MTDRLVTTPFDAPDAVLEVVPAKRRGNPDALAEYRRKVADGTYVPKAKKPPTKTKYGRPRDSQRQKLYDAEGVLAKYGDPELGTQRWSYGVSHAPGIEVAQDWVDDLTQERWFQSRWGRCQIPVEAGRGNHAGYRRTVTLSHWGRTTAYVILHEVAHWLVSSERLAAHGPEFAATYLTLVEFKLGKEAAKDLRESFVKNGVKYRSGMAAVPKPGTKTVVTKAAQDEKKKAAALQRQKYLASSWGARKERAVTVEVIRAMVAEGHFGPAGSKPRARALAVARSIEVAK